MMLLSIVIPWHRNLADLEAAIDSVLGQDWPDLELIVVANGVADADYEAARNLTDDARVRFERREVPGASGARNHGMDLSRGALVFLLDADDVFLPGKLAAFAAAYRKHPYDLAFSRGLRDRGDGLQWPMPPRLWDGSMPIGEYFFVLPSNISTSALVFSADAARRLRFDDSASPYEDPDLVIQAVHQGLKVRMLSATLYRWSDHRDENRLSRSVDAARRLTWIAALPGSVSPRARAAFRARCVAQHVFPRRFWLCLQLFAAAALTRAVPIRETALMMMRGLLPGRVKRRLLDVYLRRKAAREAIS